MTPINLEDPKYKLERARSKFQQLANAVEAHRVLRPFTTEVRHDYVPGYTTMHARVFHPVPKELAALTGEMVHDLRTGLDYVAVQIVIARGKTPNSEAKFPVYDFRSNQSRTKQQVQRHMKVRNQHEALFGTEAYSITSDMQMPETASVEELEASPLWLIHTIDNHNKHRMLNIVGGSTGVNGLGLAGNGRLEIDELIVGADRNARLVPVIDGAEMVRFRAGAGSTTGLRTFWSYYVAFGDRGPAKRQPVVETCDRLIHFVYESLDRFAALSY